MKEKISVVFLCGDRSPYGMAHLEAINEYFSVKSIIIADQMRWNIFRENLSGGVQYDYEKTTNKLFSNIKSIAKKPLVITRKMKHKRKIKSYGVPVIELHDVNSKDSIKIISDFSPDLLVSAAYPQILSDDLISIAPRGAVNFHPSLLPKYRGAHPHYWCLATGAKQSGVTAHFMTNRIDEGDIIAQISFSIEGLYYSDLYSRIVEVTPSLVEKVALFFAKNDSAPTPQEPDKSSYFRNDREIHRKLDFQNMTSLQLYNRVRAGRAYGLHREKRVYIERVRIKYNNRHMVNGIKVSPGTIVDISPEGVVVSTVDSKFLVIESVKLGNKVKPFFVWVKRVGVTIGERVV